MENKNSEMNIMLMCHGFALTPVGGFKTIYQYANGLSSLGHNVTLVHSSGDFSTLKKYAYTYVAKIMIKLNRNFVLRWYSVNKSVNIRFVPTLSEKYIKNVDVVILAGWRATEQIDSPPSERVALVELVQDNEYDHLDNELKTRMNDALSKKYVSHISISSEISKMLTSVGVATDALIPLGLNDGEFTKDDDTHHNNQTILTLKSNSHKKGFDISLKAIEIIKKSVPDVNFECFGSEQFNEMPSYINDLGLIFGNELADAYRRATVYMMSSRYEGFGLTPLEAISCSTAVVATKCGGVEDYLVDKINAKLVPVDDAISLAQSVIELLENHSLREFIAENGFQTSKQYQFSNILIQIENFLIELCDDKI